MELNGLIRVRQNAPLLESVSKAGSKLSRLIDRLEWPGERRTSTSDWVGQRKGKLPASPQQQLRPLLLDYLSHQTCYRQQRFREGKLSS